MGCATSKQKHKVCRNCHTPYSPVRRSYSLHGNRHPKYEDDDDGCHVVALTSSTLGSLKLDLLDQNHRIKEEAFSTQNKADNAVSKLSKEEFAKGVVEAMSWSKMIDEKIPKVIPKTPIRTPPGEPETINAWELMEGLEDSSPLRPPQSHHHIRSFSFNLQVSNRIQSLIDQQPTPRVRDDDAERQNPIWEEEAGGPDADDDASNSNSNDTSIVSDFDPEVISTFRKALEELPPANPFHLKPLLSEKQQASDGNNNDTLEAKTDDDDSHELDLSRERVRGKDKLIVYFTSLRGVRKTYEDSCNVRLILKALGVKIDERDVSMHSGFKEELKELLGEGWYSGGALPKVFIGSKYIGGAEEISRMHEHGQLEKLVEGCELVEDGGGGGGGGGGGSGVTCEACGDIRFVPCDTCSGSCKIYCEGDYDDDDDDDDDDNKEEEEEVDNGFQRCPDCNENGLIRCPICCD